MNCSAQTLAHLMSLCSLFAQKKPELQSRISKGYDLLVSDGVTPCPVTPGDVWVRGRKGKRYRVTAASCECKDAEKRGVPCKHAISRRLYWVATREEAIQEATRIAAEQRTEPFSAEEYVRSGSQLAGITAHEARINLTQESEVILYRSVHKIWLGIIRRCDDKTNLNYGGRGISICDRWRSFRNFMADVGPRPSPSHSIDRVDVNGHYEPSNIRWATPTQQANNRRPRKLSINKSQSQLGNLTRKLHRQNKAREIAHDQVVSIYNYSKK